MHQLSWPGGQITSAACDLRGCTTLGCAALSILKIVLLIRVLEYCVYPIDLTKVEHFVTLKGNKEGSRVFFCPATTCIIFFSLQGMESKMIPLIFSFSNNNHKTDTMFI